MTRALSRRVARLGAGLDVGALHAETALRLWEAGVLEVEQLSDSQLEAIADGRVR